MYGECVHCKDKSVPISGTYSSTTKVSFTQWVTEDNEIDKEFDRQPYHPAAQDRLPTEAKQG